MIYRYDDCIKEYPSREAALSDLDNAHDVLQTVHLGILYRKIHKENLKLIEDMKVEYFSIVEVLSADGYLKPGNFHFRMGVKAMLE